MARKIHFEWNDEKDWQNRAKHGVSFYEAQHAFGDSQRIILKDFTHCTAAEERFYCLGKVDRGTMTVRFTYRQEKIRIIGAGFWRKGKKIYEEQNKENS